MNRNYNEILKSLPKGLFQRFEDLSLDKIKRIFSEIGVYEKINSKKIIHIAGTNGKGSTSKMIFSCLKSAGFKVGVFTSPHLTSIRERAETHNGIISKEDFTSISNHILDFTDELSYFEFCLLFSLIHFLNNDCEYIVLETGLGGTYDATNIFDSYITCITSISYDHQHILGYSLEEIAGNKAGIIKKNSNFFINFKNKVIEEKVNQTGAKYSFVNYTKTTNLNGGHQEKNAGLAYAICNFIGVSDYKINIGLNSVGIAGRVQYLTNNLIIDGAHNEDSIKKLFDYLSNKNDLEQVFYFAVKKGKDTSFILKYLNNKKYYYIDKQDIMLENPEKINLDKLSPEEIINKSIKEDQKLHIVFGSLYVLQYFIDNKCLAKKLD